MHIFRFLCHIPEFSKLAFLFVSGSESADACSFCTEIWWIGFFSFFSTSLFVIFLFIFLIQVCDIFSSCLYLKMGAGRKTETFTAPPNQGLATYTTSMRNLVKKHLGGVIFGCKDITIDECLSKQLFGQCSELFCTFWYWTSCHVHQFVLIYVVPSALPSSP